MGHNGHGINLYGVVMILMGNLHAGGQSNIGHLSLLHPYGTVVSSFLSTVTQYTSTCLGCGPCYRWQIIAKAKDFMYLRICENITDWKVCRHQHHVPRLGQAIHGPVRPGEQCKTGNMHLPRSRGDGVDNVQSCSQLGRSVWWCEPSYSTNHVYLHRFSRLWFCVCV